jgi:hypothetical protein
MRARLLRGTLLSAALLGAALLGACGEKDGAADTAGGADPQDSAGEDTGGGDEGGGDGGEDSGEDSESGDSGLDTAADLCADAPTVTWANWGEGFIVERCQSCHASTSPARYGAPEDVTFDDHDQVLTWKDRILARAAGEDADMPPSGGVDEDDRYLLEVWLTCYED